MACVQSVGISVAMGTGSSNLALAKSESYSTLTLLVLNQWITNKRLRSNNRAHKQCRSTVRLYSIIVQCFVYSV
jgi:hypothetical protein